MAVNQEIESVAQAVMRISSQADGPLRNGYNGNFIFLRRILDAVTSSQVGAAWFRKTAATAAARRGLSETHLGILEKDVGKKNATNHQYEGDKDR